MNNMEEFGMTFEEFERMCKEDNTESQYNRNHTSYIGNETFGEFIETGAKSFSEKHPDMIKYLSKGEER